MTRACDFFTDAVQAFRKSDVPAATTLLRQGFFANLYVAPLLQGEEFYPQEIWYPGAEAEPRAAREYVGRYARLWEQNPAAIEFLRVIWNDPLVRAELRSFLSVSKNLLHATSQAQHRDFLAERERFLNPERIKRTQQEILDRLDRLGIQVPLPPARMRLIALASRDPARSLEFYRDLLGVEPRSVHEVGGGYVEFEFDGVHLAIHGYDRVGRGDPYGLGPPPESLGWGAVFVIGVSDVERYYESAREKGIAIVDSSFDVPPDGGADEVNGRFFVVRDPSGYLIEITEDDASGFASGR